MTAERDELQVEIGVTERRYLQQLAKLEAQSLRSAKRIENEWRRANGPSSRSMTSLDRGFRKTTGAANQFAGGMRNASLQLNQVFQQTMVTGDAVSALAIQFPDLLIGFGTLGVAAGVLGGALVPIAAEFLNIGNNGKDLNETVEDLSKSVDRYQTATKNATRPTAELREEYGELADEARRLYEAQVALERLDIAALFREAQVGIADQFGTLAGVNEELARSYAEAIRQREALDRVPLNQQGFDTRTDEQLAAATRQAEALDITISRVGPAIARVKDELGLADDEAGEFLAALVRLRDAGTMEEQLTAISQVVALYSQAVNATGGWTEAQRELLRQMIETQKGMLGFNAATADAEAGVAGTANQARLLADEISRAAQSALDFVQNLGSASLAGLRAEVAALEAGGSTEDVAVARREAEVRASPEFQAAINGPDGLQQEANANLQRELELTRESVRLRERKSAVLEQQRDASRGAATATAELSAAERLADQVLRQVTDAAVKYSDIVDVLRQKLEAGEISQDTFNAALDRARDSASGLGDVTNVVSSSFSQLFDGILSGGNNAVDILQKVAIELAKLVLFGQLTRSFPGVFGSGGILPLFNADGNAFQNGRVTAFARGGVVNGATTFPMRGGQTGVMGEAGPEAIMPLTRIGGKLGVRSAGGGGNQVVQINNFAGAEIKTRQQQGKNGQEMIVDVVRSSMARGEMQKPLAAEYGLSRTKVAR